MHLLPQMSPEDLDQRDLESRDLTMHEDTGQIQLYLETDVHLRQQTPYISIAYHTLLINTGNVQLQIS